MRFYGVATCYFIEIRIELLEPGALMTVGEVPFFKFCALSVTAGNVSGGFPAGPAKVLF